MSNESEAKNFYKESLDVILKDFSELIKEKKEWGTCNDSYIEGGRYLSIFNDGVKLSDDNIDNAGVRKIALVLESPHIKEFNNNGEGIGPAQGYTGDNLKKYLPDLIKDIKFDEKLNGTYEVKIINAIQYQTSLGLNTEIFRDRMWLQCWLRGGKQNFLYRIKLYSPDIIINLCTKGSHEDDPIINFKQLRAKTVINKEYLKTINQNLIFDNDANVKENSNGQIIYDNSYKEEKNYTLNGFVQTALNEYKNAKSTVVLIRGIHPASKKFSESSLSLLK